MKVEATPNPGKHKKGVHFEHRWAEGDFKYRNKSRHKYINKFKYNPGEHKKGEDLDLQK